LLSSLVLVCVVEVGDVGSSDGDEPPLVVEGGDLFGVAGGPGQAFIERQVVAVGDIARRVGFSKANVLRYFKSREHVFLQLLLREWDAWTTHTEVQLKARRPSTGTIANTVACTLAERTLLCDLISEMSAVLERNVSVATVQAFKAESGWRGRFSVRRPSGILPAPRADPWR
jgi:AcrR family transcriptional regulator